MKITWQIKKKRGNWRPVLNISLELDEWELDLALGKVELESKIPKPPSHYQHSCPPGSAERIDNTEPELVNKYTISLDLTNIPREWSCRLPWRPGARPEYPEVEEAMHQLREKIEGLIKEAYDSEGWEAGGELGLSEETKQHVAPGVAARRMLKVVGGQDDKE